MIHAHHEYTCYECSEDLTENVVGNFAPGETLPDCETDGYCGVEVAAGCRGAGYYGEGDAEGECGAWFLR